MTPSFFDWTVRNPDEYERMLRMDRALGMMQAA
jgi:hypothetical protein